MKGSRERNELKCRAADCPFLELHCTRSRQLFVIMSSRQKQNDKCLCRWLVVQSRCEVNELHIDNGVGAMPAEGRTHHGTIEILLFCVVGTC